MAQGAAGDILNMPFQIKPLHFSWRNKEITPGQETRRLGTDSGLNQVPVSK